MRLIWTSVLPLLLTSCSGAAPNNQTDPTIENKAVATVKPEPHYSEVEGTNYLYVSALSEDDRKAGKQVPNVSTFRFAGEKNGLFTLETIGGDGEVVGTTSCKNPCKIVTTHYGSTTEKVGYSEDSVMGAALQDAFNGFLKKSK